MIALFDAVGVLVPAPRPPKVFRPGRMVQNVIFFATMMMTILLSYSIIIEQCDLVSINAMQSAAPWVIPFYIANGAMSVQSARAQSINQVMDHECKAVSSNPGLSIKEHTFCHCLQVGQQWARIIAFCD